MERKRLHRSLLDDLGLKNNATKVISIKVDDTELVRKFDDIYSESSEVDVVSFFRLFLGAAIESDHTDLVTRLLTEKRCDLDSSMDSYIPSPLFTAIRSANVRIFEVLLCASSELNLTKEHKIQLPCDDRVMSMSVFEYACFCDERDIVKRMLVYQREQDARPYENYLRSYTIIMKLRLLFVNIMDYQSTIYSVIIQN